MSGLYLSFADDDGWRGGVFAEGHTDVLPAVTEAHLRGVNPGGEVAAWPYEGPAPAEPWRLLDEAELSAACGELVRPFA